MSVISRKTIFEQAARKLRQEFEELSTVPHNALKGQEAEKLIRTFLNNHLPKRFQVGAGFIIDRLDTVSKQTDVVVYDAFNCPVYRASDDAAIFPSDNVAAVVEVKSRLDKDQLHQAFSNINAAKGLAKTLPPPLPFPVKTHTLGCLFAFESALTLDKLAEHYYELITTQKEQFYFLDIIVVLDRGIITLAAKPQGYPNWEIFYFEGMGGPGAEGTHIALAVHEFGPRTLDAFLRYLLIHLTFFRGIVDNPGFKWEDSQANEMKLTYLNTITFEKDPILRIQKQQEYLEQVKADFANQDSTDSK